MVRIYKAVWVENVTWFRTVVAIYGHGTRDTHRNTWDMATAASLGLCLPTLPPPLYNHLSRPLLYDTPPKIFQSLSLTKNPFLFILSNKYIIIKLKKKNKMKNIKWHWVSYSKRGMMKHPSVGLFFFCFIKKNTHTHAEVYIDFRETRPFSALQHITQPSLSL